jgi:hypothetical protein
MKRFVLRALPLRRTFCAATRPSFLLLLLLAWLSSADSFALGQPHFVRDTATPGSLCLFEKGKSAGIYVDKAEYPGVIRAAHDLQADIERVSGLSPVLSNSVEAASGEVILIGTIGKSA